MSIEAWTLILMAVQTLVIFLSLGALIWQLRQVNISLQQEAYSKAVEDYSQMINRLLDKPNLNRLFYGSNKDFAALSSDEQDFYNYYALSLVLFERIYLLKEKGFVEPHIWESWERWLTEWFQPDMFKIFWANEQRFFTVEFADYVNRKTGATNLPGRI